jgi:hypothetical protein
VVAAALQVPATVVRAAGLELPVVCELPLWLECVAATTAQLALRRRGLQNAQLDVPLQRECYQCLLACPRE